MVCHFNKGIKIFIIFISASTDFAVQALERGPGGVKLSLYITFSPSLSLHFSRRTQTERSSSRTK